MSGLLKVIDYIKLPKTKLQIFKVLSKDTLIKYWLSSVNAKSNIFKLCPL